MSFETTKQNTQSLSLQHQVQSTASVVGGSGSGQTSRVLGNSAKLVEGGATSQDFNLGGIGNKIAIQTSDLGAIGSGMTLAKQALDLGFGALSDFGKQEAQARMILNSQAAANSMTPEQSSTRQVLIVAAVVVVGIGLLMWGNKR